MIVPGCMVVDIVGCGLLLGSGGGPDIGPAKANVRHICRFDLADHKDEAAASESKSDSDSDSGSEAQEAQAREAEALARAR